MRIIPSSNRRSKKRDHAPPSRHFAQAGATRIAGLALSTMLLMSCGGQGSDTSASDISSANASSSDTAVQGDKPQIVVTTNILGDVVEELVGDLADVEVIMTLGSDPHSFAASAQQIDAMTQADALIINGAGFEENLLDSIELAAQQDIPTFAAISTVVTLEFGGHTHDHEDHGGEAELPDDNHSDDDHSNDTGHSVDPHFFTDPSRMATAASGIAEFLSKTIPSLDTPAFQTHAAGYIEELQDLDAEVANILQTIPPQGRILVTNHEVFGYFADRYEFEVAGAAIPGGSTNAAANAEELAALSNLIEAEGVSAIFADTSSPNELAEMLASEADHHVQVIELFSESLGEAGSGAATYIDMIRTNALRIADALS